jgi:hypothetical protein
MQRLKAALTPYAIPYPKVRIGRPYDGGYVVFNHKLNDVTSTYSYGINDDVSFELKYTAYSNSPIHMYDHTIHGLPDSHPQFRFKKEAGSCENIVNHVTENGDRSARSLFLKMDIEGHEWDLFKNIPMNVLGGFQQIVVEFHNLEFLQNHCFGFINMTQDEMAGVFERINSLFYLGHIHGNNCGGIKEIPNTIECCYIRKDQVDQVPSVETIAYPLPGIDYPNNLNIPDYTLDWWLTPSTLP